ncbi:hypothetical protein [Pseudomonas massiliensis]|uniref:hypothetical protein n=1 Tax=Pseudomonas massiliensis TaxID=522492 RepID=UPI0011DCB3F0|nr:hypothetical protein [Pseudomonas massiliensis]
MNTVREMQAEKHVAARLCILSLSVRKAGYSTGQGIGGHGRMSSRLSRSAFRGVKKLEKLSKNQWLSGEFSYIALVIRVLR